ncbi:xanthine dehydrogenase family protein subunit M [Rhizorhabdus wittichii]|uniref:Xanthine dehydrogenase family protein subunit M n=1 Tax=Rhizorhabdus wittichii TaxID=160791 RepID=A0A975HDD3_9SPHN|nr:xanthine dehydrogenase family protein subunit M [Rhizorhabdus wittichii]QTH21148.1 xanthine dehydrogenase family protein subunit M [Rhizorhabdus wittichii]
MYPFDYHRCASAEEARALLAELGDGRFLAGGQSLLPMMKLRFVMTGNIIDLRDCEELRGIDIGSGTVTIGAMTRHVDVASSKDLAAALPVLAELAGGIGDPLVRAQGTMGGSIANNDPAADYPAACLGLGATILTTAGEIAADDFFLGVFETALEEGELVTGVRYPVPAAAAYMKFRHPASRFALAGVFVARTTDGLRVAVTGAGSQGVFRWREAEEALAADFAPEALDGAELDTSDLNSDIHADADYRGHLVRVMAVRAVGKILAANS